MQKGGAVLKTGPEQEYAIPTGLRQEIDDWKEELMSSVQHRMNHMQEIFKV